jgi:hypothetical protein
VPCVTDLEHDREDVKEGAFRFEEQILTCMLFKFSVLAR